MSKYSMRTWLGLSLILASPFSAMASAPATDPVADSGVTAPFDLSTFTIESPVLHTPARDQGYVGFCWAYSLSGLMEGESLKAQRNVVLSEEYIGFYKMYFQTLKNLSQIKKLALENPPQSLFQKIKFAATRQLIVRILYTPDEGASNLQQELDTIKLSGVVPESVFKFKIDQTHEGVQKRLDNFVLNHMVTKAQVRNYMDHNEQLFEDMASAFGARPPMATDTFQYDGNSFTPVSFMNNYMNFDPDSFHEVQVNRDNQKAALTDIHNNLKDNRSVQIGFVVMEDFENAKKTGIFDSANCPGGTCGQAAGGHAVLVVNDVVDASSDVQAVIIKNSWGATGLSDMAKSDSDPTKLGYYMITSRYLDQGYNVQGGSWSYVTHK